MRTIKNDPKAVQQLRKQLALLQEKQAGIRQKLRAALLKSGQNAGKSVRHIHAMKSRKKT